MTRIPIMLVGQEGAGKTSLKKSLKGEEFDPNEPSTRGIDIDPSLCKVSTELLKAEETGFVKTGLPNDDAVNAVSFKHDALMDVLKNVKRFGKRGENHGADSFNKNQSIDKAAKTPADDKLNSQDAKHASQQKEPSFPLQGTASLSVNPVPEIDNNAAQASEEIDELIKTLLAKKELEPADDCEIYYPIWDFAGQSVYYATHSLFLTYKAIYLLVHCLSLDPHGATESLVKQGLFRRFEDRNLVTTNFDFLHFWMTSIASLTDSDKITHECLSSLPPVIFVCTHADDPFGSKTPKVLASEILGELRRKQYKTHLVGDCYVVNNCLSGKDAEVKRLLKKIEETAYSLPQFREMIPRRWLRYEKALKAAVTEGYDCLYLSEAGRIAEVVSGITREEELGTLLNFLHDHRIVLYFRESAEHDPLIVLNPQWLVDIFKEVITVKEFVEPSQFEEDWRDLEDNGKLSRRLLEHMWKELINQRNTVEALVSIMEKFTLICRWPSSASPEEYLVPHMLKFRSTEDVEGSLSSLSVPSLFVRFHSSQSPLVLFPHLLVCLIHEWTKWWPCEEEPKIYRNFARLFLGRSGNSVTLFCHLNAVEVAFNVPEGTSPSVSKVVCPEVCSVLRRALKPFSSECTWPKAKSYDLSVLCPVCCEGLKRKSDCVHRVRNCTKEECLHFFSETVLQGSSPPSKCTNALNVPDCMVPVQKISLWFCKVSVRCDFIHSDMLFQKISNLPMKVS